MAYVVIVSTDNIIVGLLIVNKGRKHNSILFIVPVFSLVFHQSGYPQRPISLPSWRYSLQLQEVQSAEMHCLVETICFHMKNYKNFHLKKRVELPFECDTTTGS